MAREYAKKEGRNRKKLFYQAKSFNKKKKKLTGEVGCKKTTKPKHDIGPSI